jgi:predicted DNA-binding protein
MSAQVIIRIDPKMKNRVANLARAEGKSTSELVRELLGKYIQDRDIGAHIDDLWRRIGGRVKTRGIKQRDISKAIVRVRKSKR